MVPKKVVVGIDIGAESTKVVLGSNYGCEIVRNEVGGHSTSSAISFSGKVRQIGQTANVKSKNSVAQVNRLLPGEMEDGDKFQEFYQFEVEGGSVKNLAYDGSTRSFEPPALLAMLLGKIQSDVKATMKRILSEELDSSDFEYAISVGPEMQAEAKADLLDAAFAAGMEKVRLVESILSYAYCYQRKFPDHLAAGSENNILIIDMGKTQTSVAVVGAPPAENGHEEDGKEEKEPQSSLPIPIVRSSHRHKSMGAGLVDIRFWEHFQSTFPALSSVQKSSRAGQRLLEGSKKLKHLLSQLPEGEVTVENVGENDTDLKLKGSRQTLAEICKSDTSALTDLIQKVLQEAEVGKLFAVEVIGGGCRIPLIKDAILAAVAGGTEVTTLSHSLDDTSAALGAALIGEEQNPPEPLVGNEERRNQFREAEKVMAALDEDMQIRADTMNRIEAHVLEMRSAKHGKHGSLLPSTMDSYLDDVENWMFAEETDLATKDDVIAKLEATIKETREMAKDFFDALKKEKDDAEREMEAEAKKAQEERAGEPDGEEDDHDNRRLPKKRRMEIVMKNKAEANELFSDGNFKFAAARYTKALSHCAKFVDLSPDDVAEVDGVKLSLNMNLALAYLKLQKPDQALRVCNDALIIDENNVKALYRRASVYYELKNWDSASKDVKKAVSGAPDDKAIKKLQDRIDAQIKRQKMKEKKMAQKMFG
eukprot:scaffold25752_cov108-Cylindrotheca_fusiformis.AAC.1